MAAMVWTADLSVGIEVIDGQHKRIVDYINQLHDAHLQSDRHLLSRVLVELIDYTQSHFGFEESVLEDAGYTFLKAHKRVHELFIRKISHFQERHLAGENVAQELSNLLVSWLINHIKREDFDYSAMVRAHMGQSAVEPPKKGGWLAGSLRRFFGG
jgi:hemerythrin